ncbi:hypothetical protein JET14_13415 [Martelella lutilitoris]|uniref:Uncharacterized protein n=1 Tax=Martelella lutilitoris TaxID=2583532 RepID=A0A7T7HHN9_9HYPH|nr:hypothetical protein [Martelella lutilitoris]QQM29322.1 hypothetical protein JET14_13415 [Martelella lutilitoris]
MTEKSEFGTTDWDRYGEDDDWIYDPADEAPSFWFPFIGLALFVAAATSLIIMVKGV